MASPPGDGAPQVPLKRRSSTVSSDLDRRIFNIELSTEEFRRRAKEEEETSVRQKRKCNICLRTMRVSGAWRAARNAIKAQNDAMLYSIASEMLRAFCKTLSRLEEPDQFLNRIIHKVDLAVRSSDAPATIRLLGLLEDEKTTWEREESVRPLTMEPHEEDIRIFMGRMDAGNALLGKLGDPKAKSILNRGNFYGPILKDAESVDSSNTVESTQVPIVTKVKKKAKSRGRSGYEKNRGNLGLAKEVRFRIN